MTQPKIVNLLFNRSSNQFVALDIDRHVCAFELFEDEYNFSISHKPFGEPWVCDNVERCFTRHEAERILARVLAEYKHDGYEEVLT